LNSPRDIEEERRLMYVAVTRAKEKLYLMRACSRLMWGKRISAPISRFVNEIPAELISNISGVSKIGYSDLAEFGSSLENNALGGMRGADSNFEHPETKTSRVELKNSDVTLKIGDMVKHAKFGNGKILRLNADGKKVTAEIFFIGVGKKTLDLNIANIDKI